MGPLVRGGPAVLSLALLAGCAAPERLARSLELSAWTYDSESSDTGLASRVTPAGGVGSQGLLETSGSGEGYGFGVTMSLDRLLGPEVQPIRLERSEPDPDWARAYAAPAKPAAKQKRKAPSAWWLSALVPVAGGLYEAISRKCGGEGFAVPMYRGAKRLLRR